MAATDHVTEFITQGHYLRGWSPRTVQTYRAGLATFARALGGLPDPSTLTPAQLSAFVVWMREHGLTPGGCNLRIRTLNSFLSWLHEDGRTATRLRVKLLPNSPQPYTTFSDADLRRLASYAPTDWAQRRTWTLALLLLDTGLRISE